MRHRRGFRVLAALGLVCWLSWLVTGIAIAQGAPFPWWQAVLWGAWMAAATVRPAGWR